jgi:hypothetical protein
VSWQPAWEVNGDLGHVRVSPTVLGTPLAGACLEQLALKTHPQVFPRDQTYRPLRFDRWDTFPLGLVRDAVTAVDHGDVAASGTEPLSAVAERAVAHAIATLDPAKDVPAAARSWAVRATENLLEAAESLRAAENLEPGPRHGWRIVHAGDDYRTMELASWGLSYQRGDGAVRELWLLRMRPLDELVLPAQTVAAAAFITATGVPTEPGERPRQPHCRVSGSTVPAELVRIRLVSTADGADRIVWQGSPEDARAAWAPHRPLAGALTEGGSVRPGRSCIDCRARHVCAALPTSPGLLGLPTYGTHPRSLAPTALATYRVCPARYFLTKVVNLPREDKVSTDAIRRGNDTHRWLEQAHGRGIACRPEDLPADATSPGAVAEAAGLEGKDYARARPYLLQHLAHCPLSGAVQAWPERDVVVYDTDADVTVCTRPDLLIARPGGPLWRETKTMTQLPAATDRQLLEMFPQLAVAVCIVADNALGDPRLSLDSGPGLVELELLSAEASRVAGYDCADEATVHAARRAAAVAADAWHGDDTFATRPGEHCAGCEVARWCPDAFGGASAPAGSVLVIDGVRIDAATGEVIDAARTARPPTAAEATAALAVSTADPGIEDPPPF